MFDNAIQSFVLFSSLLVATVACGPTLPEGALGTPFGADAQSTSATWGAPCEGWSGWIGEEAEKTYVQLLDMHARMASVDPEHPDVKAVKRQMSFLREALVNQRMGGAAQLRLLELKMQEDELSMYLGPENPELMAVRAQIQAFETLAQDTQPSEPSIPYLDLRLQEVELSHYYGERHPRMVEVREEIASLEAAGMHVRTPKEERTHRFEVCSTGPIQAFGAPASVRVMREGTHFEALQLTWVACSTKIAGLRAEWGDALGLDPEDNNARWGTGEFILVEDDETLDRCTLTIAGPRWGTAYQETLEKMGGAEP